MTKKEKLVRKLHSLVSKYQNLFHEINLVANDLNCACEEALENDTLKENRYGRWKPPLFTNKEASLIEAIQEEAEQRLLFTNKEASFIEAIREEAEQREEILDYGNTDVDPNIFFKQIIELESLVQKGLKKAAKSKRN